MEFDQIKEILPQQYPFLFIDKVLEYKKGELLVALKNISANDWFFGEMLNESSILPETVIIETAAQAALILYQTSKVKEGEPRPTYILGKVTAEFFGPVHVGDQMKLKALATKMLDSGGYSDITVTVGSKTVAKVEIFYSVKR